MGRYPRSSRLAGLARHEYDAQKHVNLFLTEPVLSPGPRHSIGATPDAASSDARAYFRPEKSVASMKTDTTLTRPTPDAWLTSAHSGSAMKFFQFSAAASRLSCAMM